MRIALVALLSACSFVPNGGQATDGHLPGDAARDTLLGDAGDAAITADAPADGITGDATVDAPAPDPCSAVEVVSRYTHACARRADGYVWCWGENGDGEVGAPAQAAAACPNYPNACNATPVHVAMPAAATRLVAGFKHTCALGSDGQTYCWGYNNDGELGDGTTMSAATPRAITGNAGATALAAGQEHTCAISAAGGAVCSGDNTVGELGNGTMTRHLSPTAVTLPASPSAIGAGYSHSCAVVGAKVYCWGDNTQNECGSGANPTLTPTLIAGITTAVAVVGGDAHSCALLADHTAKCWGDGGYGQLGSGYPVNSPPVVVQLSAIAELSADEHHTCARNLTGQVYYWGAHALGSGPTPFLVTLPHPAVSISSGDVFDCAALEDGSVWCWGRDDQGQLGDGAVVANSGTLTQPTQVKLCP